MAFDPAHSFKTFLVSRQISPALTQFCDDVNFQVKTSQFRNTETIIHSLILGALSAWSEISLCLSLSAEEDGTPCRNRKWAELETMDADKHTVIIGIYVLSIKLIVPSFATFAHLFTIIK